MAEPSPPRNDTSGTEPGGSEAPRAERDGSDVPKPVERIRRLRLGVRAVWWSAVVLTLLFAGLALWMGIGRRDPVAILFAVLAICCAGAGYGTLLAVRRPSAP